MRPKMCIWCATHATPHARQCCHNNKAGARAIVQTRWWLTAGIRSVGRFDRLCDAPHRYYCHHSSQASTGLLKKKTMWYILVRALREKSKALANRFRKSSPAESPVPYAIKKTNKRLAEIQSWLAFSDEDAEVRIPAYLHTRVCR